MKKYKVQLEDRAVKALKKIDRYQSQIIIAWILKNLEDCENPRQYGKPLTGDKKGYWKYRVGVYRLIAEIKDEQVKIAKINIAHRREAYRS